MAPDDQPVWQQRTHLAPGGVVILTVALVLVLGMTLVSALLSGSAVAVAILGVSTLIIAVLLAMTIAFDVRVDRTGLSVDSVVGLPRLHVPLGDIAAVSVVEVNPMAEFGGWGMRWAPGGGLGVVQRSGPGIRVRRANGKVLTVTVDDAATGAALLSALTGQAPPR